MKQPMNGKYVKCHYFTKNERRSKDELVFQKNVQLAKSTANFTMKRGSLKI